MVEFVKQGSLSLTGTILHTGVKPFVLLSKIVTIRFNNAASYNIKLEKYSVKTNNSIILYDLTLAAGDVLTDNLTYALEEGDKLIAYSNIIETNYYIYGID